ncbi:MAG TPA: ATP-binding protein [Solirubrobacterales bacterium]|nr:ATP-binding protein [Solirubrobacterales bacterium]
MRRGRADRVSLAAGIGFALIGALLCLDQLDLVALSPSLFRELGIWWSAAVLGPVVLAAAGAALLWAQSRGGKDDPPPAAPAASPRPTAPAAGRASSGGARLRDLYRGGFGVALVVGAALLFLFRVDALGGARDAALTAIAAILALALILAPFIWRLGRNLAAERAERIRSQERAEMAAHLHDSVLQTLTLMQKRAGDPREVAALARRQERELRGWLTAGRPAGSGGFAAALRRTAEEVEDAHRIEIDLVTVGDCELDEGTTALVAAAREALTNAAKFAGEAGPVSVYAEVGPDLVEAFVRDRGPGFDRERIPGDRHGVRESIVGRMRRHGGDATISAVPGSGTEVALTIAREGR